MAFEVKNVEQDGQAYNELVAKGYRTIPVTFIGDQAIKGFDRAALEAALDGRLPRDR